MHESFNKNDADKFTRAWFAWANTLFGELILTVAKKSPKLLASREI
jgi:meiotically up-regulated gene 157 (Mug157) protein